MFPTQLKKILDLVKKTGDRVVVFDAANPDDSYVVMGFDDYASQASGSSKKMISAAENVKSAVENLPVESENNTKFPVNSEKKENLTDEDLTDKINREISMWKNGESSSYVNEEDKPKKAWQISPKVKDRAQEVE